MRMRVVFVNLRATHKLNTISMAAASSFLEQTRAKGRPPLDVNREQLQHLRKIGFTWKEITGLLDVSSKTLQRRAREWNITKYSSMSDDSLDEAMGDVMAQFPYCGEVMINGCLQSQNVCRGKLKHIKRTCSYT